VNTAPEHANDAKPEDEMRWRKPKPEPQPQLPAGPNYAGVYHRALIDLRHHGWCHQGGLDREGRICLLMAITSAASHVLPEDADIAAPAEHAARQLEPNGRKGSAYALIRYNDAPERTEADIHAFLDQLSA